MEPNMRLSWLSWTIFGIPGQHHHLFPVTWLRENVGATLISRLRHLLAIAISSPKEDHFYRSIVGLSQLTAST